MTDAQQSNLSLHRFVRRSIKLCNICTQHILSSYWIKKNYVRNNTVVAPLFFQVSHRWKFFYQSYKFNLCIEGGIQSEPGWLPPASSREPNLEAS